MATATKTKRKVKLQPLGDRVVIQREESEERTAGGIVLPDNAREKPQRGTVVSIGDGKLLDNGTRGALQVKPGDRVIFASYAGDTFKVEDEEYLLMREDEILAVLED
ncbi:MAG: co-chaperone GroES [Planctomycetales bacterium]|nr:co-chaperone GroES [Planctomycetales bacterium]